MNLEKTIIPKIAGTYYENNEGSLPIFNYNIYDKKNKKKTVQQGDK